MDKKILTRITLIAAAAVAVSLPLVAQMLRATDAGPAPAAAVAPGVPATAAVVPVADLKAAAAPPPARPAPAPAAPLPAPAATAPAVAFVPPPAPVGPATAPATGPAPAAPPAAVALTTAPALPASSPAPPSPATTPASRPATAPAVRDATGKPVDPDRVVITVGEGRLTAGDVDAFISDLPPEQQSVVRGEGRRALADYLVKTELLAQEARSRRLAEDPRVQRQMRLVEDQVLARALINDVKEGVDDATVRKFFEEHRAQLEIVHARHILVRVPGSRVALRPGQKELTEEQARAKATDLYNRLKAGGDFADIARRESDDTGSGRDGGDLGQVSHGRTVEPFERAAFALKEGEISPPVRSPFGWHVIQVLQRFDTPEKLAEQIRGMIGPQQTQDLIDGLEKSHRAAVDDLFFGPPAPPEPVLPDTRAAGASGSASRPAAPPPGAPR